MTVGHAISGDLTEKDQGANSIAQRAKENRRNVRVARIEGLPAATGKITLEEIDFIGPIDRRLRKNRCRRLR